MQSSHYCSFLESGEPCINICSPLDKFCWRHKNLNKPCPITGEQFCKCKYNIDPAEKPSLKDTLRKLFTDHANFTHLYIISEVMDLPNLNPITERLLQNQDDIGLAIQSVYDKQKGIILATLLKEHIINASTTVKAAKNLKIEINKTRGNIENAKNALDMSVKKLFDNSAQVSELLSSLNPERLPFDVVVSHFDEHNQYVIDIAQLYLNENYIEAVKEYDCYYTHMLYFSDMLILQ